MARVRVSRQADGDGPVSAADCAVPSPPGLADVVRGYERLLAAPVVRKFHPQAPGRRPRYAEPAGLESVSGPTAAIRPRQALSLPVHFPGRAEAERAMVEAAVCGRILSACFTAEPGARPY